jgi:outer membrane immunogenic protein
MRSVVLRLAFCVPVMIGSACHAADYGPVLRGSQTYEVGPATYRDWSGLYVGGQVGYAASGVNFSNGVSQLVANILRFTTVQDEFQPSQWASLPQQAVTRPSFGGFVGYDVQFEDTILGIEVNYNRTDAKMSSGDAVSRVVNTSDGYSNTVTVAGTGAVRLTDYGTVRLRAGWVYNSFIPYGFVGAAIGRADVMRSASVTYSAVDANPACSPNCLPPILPFTTTQTANKMGAFGYGWTLGAGIEWAVLSSVFLRGEYEYVYFADFNGVALYVSTIRAAAGVKF